MQWWHHQPYKTIHKMVPNEGNEIRVENNNKERRKTRKETHLCVHICKRRE